MEYNFYSPDELAADLESLLTLDPSTDLVRWKSKAGSILEKLHGFIDLDRSEFVGVQAFLENASFMSRQPAYYRTECLGIKHCIAQYRASP
jgi:hypothetical protein